MAVLNIETVIHAPPERCFDLIREVQADRISRPGGGEGAVVLGQTFTLETRFVGIAHRFVFEVVEVERPRMFIDEMRRGPFVSFRHVHEFAPLGAKATILRDTLEWRSPCGWLGSIADRSLVAKRLSRLVLERNAKLKRLAETVRD